MTIQFDEPAKTDFESIENDATRELLRYLGNSTNCHKLNVYDHDRQCHVGYYSKRKSVQPAAINTALDRGYRVAACTRRETESGKSVGYVEFEKPIEKSHGNAGAGTDETE